MSSATTETAAAGLTAYEGEQVRRIAAWKSEPPNPFGEVFKKVTAPGARAAERVIPDALLRGAIEKAYDAAEALAGRDDVARRAGVGGVADLRRKPLQECDRLADRVGNRAQLVTAVEGAATGAGGALTTLVDIPLLFALSLRTVLKIGHCYGEPLDRPGDRAFVLGVLLAATSESLATRRGRLAQLRDVEDWLLEETQQDVAAQEIASLLFQLEIFGEVPGVGAVSGAILNLAFIRRVDLTARRVFQERWLRANGKVGDDGVAPAEAHPRALAGGWPGALKRAAYSGSYTLGFAASLPLWLVAALVGSADNALTRGASDGAAAASDDAGRLLGRARRVVAGPTPALAPS